MSKSLSIVARLVGTAALVGAGLVGTATTATAGGNCEPGDVGCNQTGGEFCVDHAKVDPNTGEIIGYTNICEDLTIDWDHETPTCEQANGGACTNTTRDPGSVLTAPAPQPAPVRVLIRRGEDARTAR